MGIYTRFTYSNALYGPSSLPVSTYFNIFDFCYPTNALMPSLFAFTEVTPSRPFGVPYLWFTPANDLIMFSDDSADSGFRIDISIPNTITFQFTLLPTDLPTDFSDLANSRLFFSTYNQFGKMLGLLLSEDGGIALAKDGLGSGFQPLPDSAHLFNEGAYYYVFRLALDGTTGRCDLYITREDLLPTIGHQLRYTFDAFDSPVGEPDRVQVETVGNALASTTVGLSCIKLGSPGPPTNKRPVAIPGPDQTRILGSYAGFDGSHSYDPEGVTPLQFWWTYAVVPEGSNLIEIGFATTPADPTGYTCILTGSAGTFSNVAEGDLLVIGASKSVVKYVHSDGSHVVTIESLFQAGVTNLRWEVYKQEAWEGAYHASTVTSVLGREINQGVIPPPTEGDAYLLDGGVVIGPDWAGHDGEIATYHVISGWTFASPTDDQLVHVIDEYKTYRCINSVTNLWIIDDPKPWELGYWEGRTAEYGSFLPDVSGLYVIELIVNDGELDSLPAEVLLNSNMTYIPPGIIPDLSFIWDYLSDFWNLVSDRDLTEVFWSGFAMASSDELMRLWQNDYAKSLIDIQRVHQRWWLAYDLLYDEPNYSTIPAEINNSINVGGYSAAPGSAVRTYDTGTPLTGVTDQHVLVLEGRCYTIARVTATSVITSDELPTVRPNFWQIKPTVKSRFSDFTVKLIRTGDAAVFEIVDSDGNASNVYTFIYGAYGHYISFDDGPISSYLASTDYTVRFKSILRRNHIDVDELVMSVPRLQEVINLDEVDGAPPVLYENRDYVTEDTDTVDGKTKRSIRFLDETWFPAELNGTDGATSSSNFFDSASSTFETHFGAGADLSGYVLDTSTGRYRLCCVVSETRVELEHDALAPALVDAHWTIRKLADLPDTLWSEVTYFDNRPVIEANFGRLVNFTLDDLESRTDNLDYLSAVQGLWYAFWHGPTLHNIRIGAQILLGLPFAEQGGTITDIRDPFTTTRSRILIQDENDDTIIRSYLYPTILGVENNPATGLPYQVGDTIEQFAPICKGVLTTDWVEDEDWFKIFVGSGDFIEVWKTHTFGVFVDADAFNLSNLTFMISFVLRIKPTYTYPFFVVVKRLYDVIDIDDGIVFGPVIPGAGTYPTTWGAFSPPVGWNPPAPAEENDGKVVVRTSPPTYDITTRWPNDRYVSVPPNGDEFGGIHLFDTPGVVPDGWSGLYADGETHVPTKGEGAFKWDDTDESGHYIHKFDQQLNAVDLFTDGDMEDPGVAAWSAVGVPATLAKSGAQFHSGTQSLHVQDPNPNVGCYQNYPAAVDTGFQVGVRGWIYIVSGEAVFRLRDQDGVTYEAVVRKSSVAGRWLQFTLHVWSVAAFISPLRFEILTGPAGGEFYLDDVAAYAKLMPWVQCGYDRYLYGRTGGYTVGGSPDEDWAFVITGERLAPAIPTFDDALFAFDASSVEDDIVRLSGPAPAPIVPPVSKPDPLGPWPAYGPPVDQWTNVTHPGYGPVPNPGLRWDTPIPAGWYTRITRRNKYSS